MSIIGAIREFIKTYPPLSEGRLNIDFLPEEAQTYSVNLEPCEEVEARYITGQAKRQCIFTLASNEVYVDDIDQNAVNLEFYEEFARWMQAQNMIWNYPKIGNRYTVTSIETTTPGYLFVNDINDMARYQIQCRMRYVDNP